MRTYPKGLKRPDESETSRTVMIRYEDMNGADRLFGGRLMEWMDETATITAMRHTGQCLTTAAVDHLTFQAAAYLNEMVVIYAKVTYVGNTSMEVRTEAYAQNLITNECRMINRAYFTEVCIDENGKPVSCNYGVEPVTEDEKREYEGAQKRIEARKRLREEGY